MKNKSRVLLAASTIGLLMATTGCAVLPVKPVPLAAFLEGSWSCKFDGDGLSNTGHKLTYDVQISPDSIDLAENSEGEDSWSGTYRFSRDSDSITTDDLNGGGWHIEKKGGIVGDEPFNIWVTLGLNDADTVKVEVTPKDDVFKLEFSDGWEKPILCKRGD